MDRVMNLNLKKIMFIDRMSHLMTEKRIEKSKGFSLDWDKHQRSYISIIVSRGSGSSNSISQN